MGDPLGEIVGSAQVFSRETYFPLDVTIHDRLPGVIGYVDIQGQRGTSSDGGYFALLLAPFSCVWEQSRVPPSTLGTVKTCESQD